MAKIQILDESVVSKIAAGEVIERPASIVKELIENSIDAHAKNIQLFIKDGGKTLIKVVDDGDGMDKGDLSLSTIRHATSKIKTEDDLFSIKTLGFRGEALASIASVAELEIITKTKENETGLKLKTRPEITEGSKNAQITEAASSKGTSITIKNLFTNVPARKKFMKSSSVEQKHIINIITEYSLCHSEISFRVYNNKALIFNAPLADDIIKRISDVYGNEIAENMIKIDFSNGIISIKGAIGKPDISRNEDYQSFYINQRYIKSKLLSKAVTDAYKSMLFLSRKPIVVLDLKIDPSKIDVNIHPTKLEVKFDNEEFVYMTTYSAIKKILESNNLFRTKENRKTYKEKKQPNRELRISSIRTFQETKKPTLNRVSERAPRNYPMPDSKQSILSDSKLKPDETNFINSDNNNTENSNHWFSFSDELSKEAEKLPFTRFRILGQIDYTYIVLETEKGMALIDQHAAAERVNFEKVKSKFDKGEILKQALLSPKIIKVHPKNKELLKEKKSYFETLGFEIDPFQGDDFIVRSIPSSTKFEDLKEVIDEILDNIIRYETKEKSDNKTILKNKILETIACRMSIKAGKELTLPESRSIIVSLMKCKRPFTCPHGRPTLIEFTSKELEKRFHRTA